MNKCILALLLLCAINGFAQKNFSYTPERPQPGDVIRFYYEPAGAIAGTAKLPVAFVVEAGKEGNNLTDIVLKRENGRLTGSIRTAATTSFVAFGFSVGGRYDTNNDEGYLAQLYDGDKPCQGANAATATFYANYSKDRFGVETDYRKALEYYNKEFTWYPESRTNHLIPYLQTALREDLEKGRQLVQLEIERTLKTGLNNAADYDNIISMYGLLKLKEQGAYFSKLRNEKSPPSSGEENILMSLYNRFNATDDPAKKEAVLAEVLVADKNKGENNNNYQGLVKWLQENLAFAYLEKKNQDDFKKVADQITDQPTRYRMYNAAAWKLQKDSSNLALCEALSKAAVIWAKNEIAKPTAKKPALSTKEEWEQKRKATYAQYANTYGMVLYRLGQYKKGLPFIREAALEIEEGRNVEFNNTYALLAEKVLPAKTLKPQLEQFVISGTAKAGLKEILRRLYASQEHQSADFDSYFSALEKTSSTKMYEELNKSKINEPAPEFTLNDLQGKPVSLASLKGKIVIVDFWATWCGPCKASFPAMQKMVAKYKDRPDVTFLFVDTWETGDDKVKDAANFIAKAGYTFHVLSDADDKTVKDYKVSSIPSKFVIGKDGNIKFRSVGFDGEEALAKELAAMIELSE